MIYFLFITALTVSLDSFFCGFSLSVSAKKKLPIVAGIAVTVLLMCTVANYGAILLRDVLNERTAALGGIILVAVGIYNLVKKETDVSEIDKSILTKSIVVGFAVGLDGACANLSLALMGIDGFYVPVLIAAMHALTIYLGILLAETRLKAVLKKIGFLPPLVLIVLGLYKLTGFIF